MVDAVQMQRWMQQNDCVSGPDSRQDSSSNSLAAAAGHVPADKRPKLTLTLDNQADIAASDQLVAAEAVIAAMYSAGNLDSLTDSQLLSMAITADMLQLDPTAQQAVDCLSKRENVSSDVQQQFMALPAWPPAVLPLFTVMATSMPPCLHASSSSQALSHTKDRLSSVPHSNSITQHSSSTAAVHSSSSSSTQQQQQQQQQQYTPQQQGTARQRYTAQQQCSTAVIHSTIAMQGTAAMRSRAESAATAILLLLLLLLHGSGYT
jgi:hypothetical protein